MTQPGCGQHPGSQGLGGEGADSDFQGRAASARAASPPQLLPSASSPAPALPAGSGTESPPAARRAGGPEPASPPAGCLLPPCKVQLGLAGHCSSTELLAALAGQPAGGWQREAARSIPQPPSCCSPDGEGSGKAPGSPGAGVGGIPPPPPEELIQALRPCPDRFRRPVLLADLPAPCAPQTAEGRLCPSIKPADAGQGCARSGLSLVQADLSTPLTYGTQSLNLKLEGVWGGWCETKSPWMESRHRTRQDPTHAHFFMCTSPLGGRTGAKQPQPHLSRACSHGEGLGESPHTWEPRHSCHAAGALTALSPHGTSWWAPSAGTRALSPG